MNTLEKEQLKPEFVAINPQHTVPTLVDEGKAIWDSHAINAYLVTKYAQNDLLYPKEAYARAVVDQRLHFDNGVVFPRFAALVKPIFHQNQPEWNTEAVKDIEEALQFLEIFLGDNAYLAGNKLTIADFSSVAIVTTILSFELFGDGKFPKINAWIKRLQQLPYYQEANGQHVDRCLQLFKGKLAANKAAAEGQ